MRIRSDFWRFTMFTSLGLCPNACGGRALDNTVVGEVPLTNGSAEEGGSEARSAEPTTPAPVSPVTPTPPESACGQSTPQLFGEVATGLFKCESGLLHRPSADVECPSRLPRDNSEIVKYGDYNNTCESDSDCTAAPHGYCSPPIDGGQVPSLSCRYGCLTDADCGEGNACVCGDPVGECVKSNCTEDADCGEGFLCATWDDTFGIGCPVKRPLLCQTADDECAVDEDCPQGDYGSRCSGADGKRRCVEIDGVACGRPFLVEGLERLAALSARPFGSQPLSPAAYAGLAQEIRESAGQHWAQIGLMEHASIAAFARFALQLMHLGAPLALLESAQQAMADETRHAKLCFAIASGLLGRDVGPSQLPVDGALLETSLEDVVRLVVREGCIGETVAAMEASEARLAADEPCVRAALDVIHVDEANHARLAWQFVQWALAKPETSASLRAAVASEFAAAVESARSSHRSYRPSREAAPALGAALARLGVLDEATRADVRFVALTEVIAPCAAELLRATERRDSRPNLVAPVC